MNRVWEEGAFSGSGGTEAKSLPGSDPVAWVHMDLCQGFHLCSPSRLCAMQAYLTG